MGWTRRMLAAMALMAGTASAGAAQDATFEWGESMRAGASPTV